MLQMIDHSLAELLQNSSKKLSENDRMLLFLENNENDFTRKNYIAYFKDISTATASRDLKNAVEKSLIEKYGDKNTSTYRKK
jgi:Fic family protein